jgi:hypothetical protein
LIDMSHFEALRRSYRPRRITTLFVGESVPHGGTFFYNQDSGLFREMRKATGSDVAAHADFYDTFYADVQTRNRFSLVASPAQADPILELSVITDHFTLRILDAKSTVVLWSMSEAVGPANRTTTAVKNEHTALLNLAGDLKQICLPTP